MTLFSLFAGGVVLACLCIKIFSPKKVEGYKNRIFYRTLYTVRGFDLIQLVWLLFGKIGAGIITRTIGLGYALSHPATVRAIRSNIALLDPKQATFAAGCRLLMNQAECFSLYGLLLQKEPAAVMEQLGAREGFEHLQNAHLAGKGCLLVTGHLGFFELGGLVMTELGFPMTALTLPEPSTELTQWRANFRAHWGVKTIVIGEDAFSVVEIVRALHAGAFVALLVDRPFDHNTTLVQLPHGQILFSTAPALISLLAQCPIIPVGVSKQRDGKHRISARPAIEPSWLPAGRAETLSHYTREIASGLIPLFAETPEQWYHFSELKYTP